ncbi:MAG: nicotinate phosphoribosyltransferase, partial [Anaerolineae bacterium]|nr:nicotinate phosphoribosyltransferase [Anaerolineae bacterium]
MTVFDHQRNTRINMDFAGLRRGLYSDKYFANVVDVLTAAQASGYRFAGRRPRPLPVDLSTVAVGELVVEAQV